MNFIDTKELYKEFISFYNENFNKKETGEIDKNYIECKFTKYKFKEEKDTERRKNNGYRKSIFGYYSQMTEDIFFILINRKIIKKMYEEDNFSTRDIIKYLINNNKINYKNFNNHFIKSINKTDILIKTRNKKDSCTLSCKKAIISGNNFRKNKLIDAEIDIKNLNDTEINKKYRSYILSPFQLRKNGLEWNEIEKRTLSNYDIYTRDFIQEYVDNGKYNFESYFRNKSKLSILTINKNITDVLGKKIVNYFGLDKILYELKLFYSNIINKTRFLKNKIFERSKKHFNNYYGYVDGRLVTSLNEAKLTAILLDNNIDVRTNNSYTENETQESKKYFYDLFLPEYNIYVEYLGMMEIKEYSDNIIEKKKFCIDKNFNVIYSDNIEKIFNEIENKINIKLKKEILYPISIVI